MTIYTEIENLLKTALKSTVTGLGNESITSEDVFLERTQDLSHGDFATSLPLKICKKLKLAPMELGTLISSNIPKSSILSKIEVAKPGFINLFIDHDWICKELNTVIKGNERYGETKSGKNKKVQIEFVSVNPTGPLHVGHVRGAVFGSTLANIMKAAGFDVQKEYYVNDAGNQMSKFFESVYARWLQVNNQEGNIPEDGYHGEYLIDTAKTISESIGYDQNSKENIVQIIGHEGLKITIETIKNELDGLGIKFDNWFSEKSLYEKGQYKKILAILEEEGHLVVKDGAKWFTSTEFDDSRDNVVVRSSGTATYFGTDIAYHYNKFKEREFALVIDIWGADHQGHIKRMKGAMQAIGIDPDNLNIITTQMVSIKNQNERIKLSTRKNQLVTLKELIDLVGKDACRYFFITRSPESQMEFDMDLATTSSSENPVYYIQYAHARTSNILRTANEQNLDYSTYDLTLLKSNPEISLINKILMLPELIDSMALYQQPHHLPHYSLELANRFHSFYEKCRVISNDVKEKDLSKARLQLVNATKITLKRCLELMGMSAPDKM